MATIQGLTKDRMLEIEAAAIVSGQVDATKHLILTKHDGSTIDAGQVMAEGVPYIQQEVMNQTGATLVKGTVVYVTGANGTNVLVGKAQANAENTSSKTLGILAHDIAQGAVGSVMTEGVMTGLNTSSALNAGDPIWLSPTTAGGMVFGLSNKPVAPNHMVYLGVVIRKQQNNGEIYIKVQNGYELDELHNVQLSDLAQNNLLTYNAFTQLWKNSTANQIGLVETSDARLTDSRIPSGSAGGDLTGSYPNPTLKNTGSAGTYRSVTTDAQGRVTEGTNPTTIAGYGITDGLKNVEAKILRTNSSDEGGQLNLARSLDNATSWSIDAFGSGPITDLRFIANDSTVPARLGQNGNMVVTNTYYAYDGTVPVVLGNDGRLSDARTPTSHTHPQSQITGGSYTNFTPTFAGFVLNNGGLDFRYTIIGKTVIVHGYINIGTGTSWGGYMDMSPPISTNGTYPVLMTIGYATALRSTGPQVFHGNVIYLSPTAVRITWANTTGTYAFASDTSSGVPFGWVNGNSLCVYYTYETS